MTVKNLKICALGAASKRAREAGVHHMLVNLYRNRYFQGYINLQTAVRLLEEATALQETHGEIRKARTLQKLQSELKNADLSDLERKICSAYPADWGSGVFGGGDLSDAPSINVKDSYDAGQHIPQENADVTDPFNVLDEVKATLTERGGEYGDATIEDSFPRIRRYWTAFFKNRFNLDVDLTDADVASLMVLMKTARIDANPTHEDSHKDRIGYAAQAAIKTKG